MGNVLKTATDWEEFTTDSYFTDLYGSAGLTKKKQKQMVYGIFTQICGKVNIPMKDVSLNVRRCFTMIRRKNM